MSDNDEMIEYDLGYSEDDLDFDDEFDPNRCPSCGAELVFGVCIMSDCMWTETDDDDE